MLEIEELLTAAIRLSLALLEREETWRLFEGHARDALNLACRDDYGTERAQIASSSVGAQLSYDKGTDRDYPWRERRKRRRTQEHARGPKLNERRRGHWGGRTG